MLSSENFEILREAAVDAGFAQGPLDSQIELDELPGEDDADENEEEKREDPGGEVEEEDDSEEDVERGAVVHGCDEDEAVVAEGLDGEIGVGSLVEAVNDDEDDGDDGTHPAGSFQPLFIHSRHGVALNGRLEVMKKNGYFILFGQTVEEDGGVEGALQGEDGEDDLRDNLDWITVRSDEESWSVPESVEPQQNLSQDAIVLLVKDLLEPSLRWRIVQRINNIPVPKTKERHAFDEWP